MRRKILTWMMSMTLGMSAIFGVSALVYAETTDTQQTEVEIVTSEETAQSNAEFEMTTDVGGSSDAGIDKELLRIADLYERPYDEIVNQVIESKCPDHEIFDHFHMLYKAMDDWVVVKTDEEYENITQIIMKKNQGVDNRIETFEWS